MDNFQLLSKNKNRTNPGEWEGPDYKVTILYYSDIGMYYPFRKNDDRNFP